MAITIIADFDTVGFSSGNVERKQFNSSCVNIGLQTLSDQYQTGSSIDGYSPRVGTTFAKFITRQYDHYASGCYEDRCLGQYTSESIATNRPHRFYGWSTLFPSQTLPSNWFLFSEVHAAAGAQAPFKWRWDGAYVVCRVNTGQVTQNASGGSSFEWDELINIHPMVFGVWFDYIVEIDWTADTSGLFRLWWRQAGQANYTLAAERLNKRTLQVSANGSISSHYWLLGLYRNAQSYTNSIYHDNFRYADTFAELSGNPPAPPPPPTIANSFGYTDSQGSLHGSLPDFIRVCKYTASNVPANQVLNGLTMWIEPQQASGQESRKLVIYSDSGGEPATLLGETEELTFTAADVADWYTFDFASPVSLDTGTTSYWIGDISGGNGNIAQTRKGTTTTPFRLLAATYTEGAPASWDTASDSAFDLQMSIYGVWQNGAAVTTGQAAVNAASNVSAVGTVSGTTTGNIIPAGRVVWVPTVQWAPITRGEWREVDANGGVLGPARWNETDDQWERI